MILCVRGSVAGQMIPAPTQAHQALLVFSLSPPPPVIFRFDFIACKRPAVGNWGRDGREKNDFFLF